MCAPGLVESEATCQILMFLMCPTVHTTYGHDADETSMTLMTDCTGSGQVLSLRVFFHCTPLGTYLLTDNSS